MPCSYRFINLRAPRKYLRTCTTAPVHYHERIPRITEPIVNEHRREDARVRREPPKDTPIGSQICVSRNNRPALYDCLAIRDLEIATYFPMPVHFGRLSLRLCACDDSTDGTGRLSNESDRFTPHGDVLA